MRCDEVQALLIEAADGSLPGPLRAEMEGHLAACPACRAEAGALRELLQAAAADPVPEPPAPYWAAARQDLARRLGLKPPPSSRPAGFLPRRAWVLGGAAAALLLALAAAFLAGRGPAPLAPTAPSPEELALLRNLEVVQDLELLEQVDILEHYELLRTFVQEGRAT
ncbi:MAG TPA: zf-HC2 domain-containing protein [Candidatus Methylomirabilis sp.]|jgi:anti-sigma factor RsiW|nr:zf-HC2 domain-containing protein [Candidatus Methylomirabilis sp.]